MLNKCFIIMPFSKTKTIKKEEWDRIYDDLFLPIWQDLKFQCERINIPRGSITKKIIEKLFSADVVFADLTDTNPNVMYELGIRHAFRKPSIMIKQRGHEIPFDVRDYQIHDYENTATGVKNLKKIIQRAVIDIKKRPEKPDNPVWDFLRDGQFMVEYQSDIQSKNKLESLKDEFENNLAIWSKFRIMLDTKQDEDKIIEIRQLILTRIDCLNLLITTRYIPFQNEDWEIIMYVFNMIFPIYILSKAWLDPWVKKPKKSIIEKTFSIDLTIELLQKGITLVTKRIQQISLK